MTYRNRGARRERGRGPVGLVLALLLALVLPAAAQTSTNAPVAEVDGEAITAVEVEKAIGAPLNRLEQQIYELKRQRLDALITERLLAREAAKRGVSVQVLLDAEVAGKADGVTDQEIETAYQAQKAHVKGDEATVRAQIEAELKSQKLAARRQVFLRSLRSETRVIVNLQAPPIFRADVSTDGAPSKGSGTAPVTIVEFQDFHCPFCERVQPTLAQLVGRYGERIKLVYRDFPIDQLHPQARKAHEAARCAGGQGKFWRYHDVLFAKPKKSSPDDLKTYARDAGLDMNVFERCVNNATYRAAVQSDIEEGIRLGVTGTPTFFINGRLLSGAQPVERFVSLIEEELTRAR